MWYINSSTPLYFKSFKILPPGTVQYCTNSRVSCITLGRYTGITRISHTISILGFARNSAYPWMNEWLINCIQFVDQPLTHSLTHSLNPNPISNLPQQCQHRYVIWFCTTSSSQVLTIHNIPFPSLPSVASAPARPPTSRVLVARPPGKWVPATMTWPNVSSHPIKAARCLITEE